MKKSVLYLYCFFALISIEASGQNMPALIAKISTHTQRMTGQLQSFRIYECQPDSILGYIYDSPTDSFLVQSQILQEYDEVATTIYTYLGLDQQLYAIDSTAWNEAGQPIFNEYRERNEETDVMEVEDRLFCYPHTGSVQNYYFFPEFIIHQIAPQAHDFVAFDSTILYQNDFFTGELLPEEKEINVYSSSGLLQEVQLFNWDAFSTMSWVPASKLNHFYTSSDKVEYTEEYLWTGTAYVLQKTTDYIYDLNDSLVTATTTNQFTGLPVEKIELQYDLAANTNNATFYIWDEYNQQWAEALIISAYYDEIGRFEVIEVTLNFFGSTDGSRYEYQYIGDSPCPWYIDIYEYEGENNWFFDAKFYYSPSFVTATEELKPIDWSVYPNPATDGIWVRAPYGTPLQLSTLQGEVLYTGTASGENEFFHLRRAKQDIILTLGQGKKAVSQIILVY